MIVLHTPRPIASTTPGRHGVSVIEAQNSPVEPIVISEGVCKSMRPLGGGTGLANVELDPSAIIENNTFPGEIE